MNLRCPKCGSENLHVDKKGFSTKRAVAGALLTGNVFVAGAAGLCGSNKIKITCLDCGKVFDIGEGKHCEKQTIDSQAYKTIPKEEQPLPQMYMCECGKSFSSEKEHAYCPKCGRRMTNEDIARFQKFQKLFQEIKSKKEEAPGDFGCLTTVFWIVFFIVAVILGTVFFLIVL